MTQPTAGTNRLPDYDAQRIRQVLHVMPFVGALPSQARGDRVETVQDVIALLVELSERLTEHASGVNAKLAARDEKISRLEEELRYHQEILLAGRLLFAALAEPRD